MKVWSTWLAICVYAVLLVGCVIAATCVVMLSAGDAMELTQRILAGAGVFITSLSLCLGGLFVVFAVTAYGHVSSINKMHDTVATLAERMQKLCENAEMSLQQGSELEEGCRKLEAESRKTAIACWDGHFEMIISICDRDIDAIDASRRAKKKKEELILHIQANKERVVALRAESMLELERDLDKAMTHLHTFIALNPPNLLTVLDKVQKRWPDDKTVAFLVDQAIKKKNVSSVLRPTTSVR